MACQKDAHFDGAKTLDTASRSAHSGMALSWVSRPSVNKPKHISACIHKALYLNVHHRFG